MAEDQADALFLYDLTSPYAYLAAQRVDALIADVQWRPVYALAIFRAVGRQPWPLTRERERRMREIEARALSRSLPALRWPEGWPHRPLLALRAAVIATDAGLSSQFARSVFHLQFAEGRRIDDEATISEAAVRSGLEPRALLREASSSRARDLLRLNTERAIQSGVVGIPSILVGDRIFWGDDRLDAAAAAASEM